MTLGFVLFAAAEGAAAAAAVEGDDGAAAQSPLGVVPHQIRGFLVSFQQVRFLPHTGRARGPGVHTRFLLTASQPLASTSEGRERPERSKVARCSHTPSSVNAFARELQRRHRRP